MNIKKAVIKLLLTVLLIITVNSKQIAAQPADCISDIHTVEVNETTLHYIECGKGEPLVLVHGSLGDYRTWISQIEAFLKEYRVISYSRRYHYPNPWPQDASDFSATVHAKDLKTFIQTLNLGKVHLVGHSYGALTSLLVARDNPELVRSLTLGEPPAFSLLSISSQGNSLFQSFMENAVVPSHHAFENGNIEDGIRFFINGVLGDGAYEQIPPIVHISMLENTRVENREIAGQFNQGIDFYSAFSCGDAEQMTIPVMLLEGERSPEMFGLIHDHLEQCFPDVDRTIIPSASHDLKIQEPPVFRVKVLSFLNRH